MAYDALGREVAVLHDGPLAAGPRQWAWNASALPAGVYLLRATADGRIATRAVTLAR